MTVEYPVTGRSVARPVTAEELDRDTKGFTSPNLHRRIDPKAPNPASNLRISVDAEPVYNSKGELVGIYNFPIISGKFYRCRAWATVSRDDKFHVQNYSAGNVDWTTHRETYGSVWGSGDTIIYTDFPLYSDSDILIRSPGYLTEYTDIIDRCDKEFENFFVNTRGVYFDNSRFQKFFGYMVSQAPTRFKYNVTCMYIDCNTEQLPRNYILSINGLNSYRTTTINYHDEESTTVEIP